MAELVQLRLEYEVPELEEMKRVGLFSLSEIRKIVKRREAFEYKLRRSKKRKEDFLQYIKFEMSLLMLVSKKRERLMIESKKKEIDNAIAQKINRLFKRALSYFPEDEKLWLDQIQYCIKMKWHDSINALYTRMLQVHSRSPELWVMAAKWEIEDNNSPDNARKLLQRAVLMNPKSE
ncbi:U3 small nucleolar RNA-associated protein 6-like protein, partial [Stegodyphus mimosarum]